MSLYVRLNCDFFRHRKTVRLRAAIGDAALWIPPRLWTYAAEYHADGILDGYSADQLASAIDYRGDASSMLQALLQAGFLDDKPLRIHDWLEFNGYHKVFAERAKTAANARWQRERTKEKDNTREEREPSNASSIGTPTKKPPLEDLEDWKITKDLERLQKQITEAFDATPCDAGLLAHLREQKKGLKAEQSRRGAGLVKPKKTPSKTSKSTLTPKSEPGIVCGVTKERMVELAEAARAVVNGEVAT